MKNENGFAHIIIPLVIVLVGLAGTVTYVGVKNANEVQETNTIEDLKEDGEVKIPLLNIFRKSDDKITETDNLTDTDEDVSESDQKECPKPNTWVQIVTQKQINDALAEDFEIEFLSYKLEGGEVTLGNNSLEADLDIGNSKKVYVKISLTAPYLNGGKYVKVDEIKSIGTNKISAIELAAIKTTINNSDKFIWKLVPEEYKEMYQYMQIFENSKIDIYLYTSEYLECINN